MNEISFPAFSDELQKIAADDGRERARTALQHSVAAALGAGVGAASGKALAAYVDKHHKPQMSRIMRSKMMRVGLPAATAAGALYASNKYRKNLEEAYRRMHDE